MTDSLVSDVTAVMGEVAREIILPRYRQLGAGDVRSKTHPDDLVTIADEEAELRLAERLTALLPGSSVLGEETAAADPTAWERLLKRDPLWIVDPIDGTSNFVHGIPRFAIIIALVRNGATEGGWIHDPLTARTLFAVRGGGAWIAAENQEPGRLIMPASPREIGALTAAIYDREFRVLKRKFAQVTRQGSAAHDYWAIADGRLHVVAYPDLKPWDHAAGVLIHTEAGGYDAMLSGAPYDPLTRIQSGLLCAPSQDIWRELIRLADSGGA